MSPKKTPNSSLQWKNQVESILQRIQRVTISQTQRPPDAATAELAKGLAQLLLDGISFDNSQQVANEVITCLIQQEYASPSLSTSFFETIAADPRDKLLQWIPPWILQAEEACVAATNKSTFTCFTTLSCMISAFVQCCCSLDCETSLIADTYNRLKLSYSRTNMLREFCRFAQNIQVLTPLMACCVLNLSVSRDEKQLFLSSVWQRGWKWITQSKDDESEDMPTQFLVWMTTSLHLFLQGVPNESRDSQHLSMELAFRWFTEVVEMMNECAEQLQLDSAKTLVTNIFNKILPHFVANSSSTHVCLNSVIEPLCNVVSSFTKELPIDRATWFRLGALLLSTPSTTNVASLLTLLGTLTSVAPINDTIVQGMLDSIMRIFSTSDECKEPVNEIRKRLASSTTTDKVQSPIDDLTSLVQLFRHGDDDKKLLEFMTMSLEQMDPVNVSAFDQTYSLLLGCSLLCSKDDAKDDELIHSYLKALLQQFPHLGITSLPILIWSIQNACDNNDGSVLMNQLEFVCDAVVKDANCAQQVWSLVGVTMTSRDSPTSVRTIAIRMFPRLVANNKKLYRRVIDTLGSLVDSKEREIRLAVAVTIDDLAREDRVRDVSDIVGWVQSYLSDEDSSVVHYAVICLHHLVVSEELDFALVMKVLNKRLCPIGDVEALLALSDVVLEALVLLLGDGKYEDDSDSDEDDISPASRQVVGVSPQVSAAVDTLIRLANSKALSHYSSNDTISRVRHNIFKSLSGYSLHFLGLDDEGVQSAVAQLNANEDRVAVTDAGLRYIELKQAISKEMQAFLSASPMSESDPLVVLTRKLLSLEEEALGSSLWQKHGKKTGSNKPEKTSAPKSAYSALPSSDQIEALCDAPSVSAAVASLLSYPGSSIEDLFDFASEFTGGVQDPVSHAFNLQAWLHAMGMIWSSIILSNDESKLEALKTVADEVRSWRDSLDISDISYLVLAVFSIYVPDVLVGVDGGSDVDCTQLVEGIRDEVLAAFEAHQFDSRDMADLCLGIVSARAVHSRATTFVDASIGLLEQSLLEHGGQASFGGSYGLSLITQAAAEVSEEIDASVSSDAVQQRLWIQQIVSLLVSEIRSCLALPVPVVASLVACLRTGKATPDLVSLIAATSELEVSEAQEQKIRGLLVSLALCINAVGIVSRDLLLGLYRFLEKLPWGTGKGFALPPTAFQCVTAGVLEKDTESIAAVNETAVNDMAEARETKRLSDALFALAALQAYFPSKETKNNAFEIIESLLENKDSSRSDEFHSSLLLSVTILVSNFPCLAVGGQMFCSNLNLHSQVNKKEAVETVGFLSDAVREKSGPSSTGRAIESLGLLAAAKVGQSNALSVSVFGTSSASSKDRPARSATQGKLGVNSLPIPHDGTILFGVMACIKQEWQNMIESSQTPVDGLDLARLLPCLDTLSLPSEFARAFIEPILSTDIEAIKPACVQLLMSQVSGRRRAAFDGRDFVKLVNRLSLLPPTSFEAMTGKGSGPAIFMTALHGFLPKLPSDNIEAVLQNLWTICEAEYREERSSSACAVGYLSSLSTLLASKQEKESLRLSPRTYTTIVQVLIQTVSSSLASGRQKSIDGMDALLDTSYIECLSHVEESLLNEQNFFALKGGTDNISTDISRAFCIVGLISRQYFEQDGRSSKQLLKVVGWYANLDSTSNTTLLDLGFRLAIAAKTVGSDGKKEILSLLFEALHIRGPGKSLELLAMLASMWTSGSTKCDAESSEVEPFFNVAGQDSILPPSTMTDISLLLLNDMPFNMAAFGRSMRLQGLIGNNVLRIVRTWSGQGMKGADLSLSSLEGVLVCCRTLDVTKEQDLATLLTSLQMPLSSLAAQNAPD